jgi:hypothetical protein
VIALDRESRFSRVDAISFNGAYDRIKRGLP